MSEPPGRSELIAILRLAYSGRLAVGYAYRGHWHSLADSEKRIRIHAIEEEEWHHRRLVGEMLTSLGTRPERFRDLRAAAVGRALGILCYFVGWLAPMYAAGKLESRNIRQYEQAARHAHECGRDDLVDPLLTMAEVEWEHEAYFRSWVYSHRWSRHLRLWPSPPPKQEIRSSFPYPLRNAPAGAP